MQKEMTNCEPLAQKENSFSDNLESLRRKFTSEEINSLPAQQYHGKIVLVKDQLGLEEAVEQMQQEEVLGFDTETRPVFRKGKSYPPCLIQLAASDKVYIFQLRHVPLDENLIQIFSNPNIIKAGIAVHDDIRDLKKIYDFQPKGMLDLSQVARHNKLETHGLRNMAANFFGIRIPKGERCSNWANKTLTKKQMLYAATDAWIGRELYYRMKERGLVFPKADIERNKPD